MISIGPGTPEVTSLPARRWAVVASLVIHIGVALVLIGLSSRLKLSAGFTHPGATISRERAVGYDPADAPSAVPCHLIVQEIPAALVEAARPINELVSPGATLPAGPIRVLCR